MIIVISDEIMGALKMRSGKCRSGKDRNRQQGWKMHGKYRSENVWKPVKAARIAFSTPAFSVAPKLCHLSPIQWIRRRIVDVLIQIVRCECVYDVDVCIGFDVGLVLLPLRSKCSPSPTHRHSLQRSEPRCSSCRWPIKYTCRLTYRRQLCSA